MLRSVGPTSPTAGGPGMVGQMLDPPVPIHTARRVKAVKELDEAVAALREAVSPTGKARSVLSHHILAIMAADDARKSAPAP